MYVTTNTDKQTIDVKQRKKVDMNGFGERKG